MQVRNDIEAGVGVLQFYACVIQSCRAFNLFYLLQL